MKMGMKDGQIMLKELDATQMTVVRSWNKMKWNKSLQMMIGDVSLDLLDRLARLVVMPPGVAAVRDRMRATREAVDQERAVEHPMPIVQYPVKRKLYEHQVRAANMALITFEIAERRVDQNERKG